MSILDKTQKKAGARRTAVIYLGAAVFCGLFGLIYEQFSHGVYSPFLGWMFLFPLLLGALPFLLLWRLPSVRYPGTMARYAYHSGLAALTLGSCLTGIFEIYGSAAPLVKVYWVVGGILLGFGVLACLAQSVIQSK